MITDAELVEIEERVAIRINDARAWRDTGVVSLTREDIGAAFIDCNTLLREVKATAALLAAAEAHVTLLRKGVMGMEQLHEGVERQLKAQLQAMREPCVCIARNGHRGGDGKWCSCPYCGHPIKEAT